jgi:uncharacterized protein YybS (DUF2232 family)
MQRLEVISKFFLASVASVLLFTSGISLPPLGVIFLPFVAQPVLIFGLKYGIVGGVAVLALATLTLVIFAGEELGLLYGVFAIMAALLLRLLGRVRAIDHLVAAVAGVMLATTAAVSYYFFGSWAAMYRDFRQSMTRQFEAALQLQEKMGFGSESVTLLKERTGEIIDMILQLLPALLLLSFAFIVLINLLYLRRRFPERRSEWFALEHLREWKSPEMLVWGLIVCGFALFIPGLRLVQVIALNVLVVVGAYYFAQGLAVIGFFFHKNNVPRFLRGLTYVLIVFQQIFTLLVVGVGLFDLWGDFRRLGKGNAAPSQAA